MKNIPDGRYSFGDHWSFNYKYDPKRLGFVLARYKFAASQIRQNATILELGCSDGIGAPLLLKQGQNYTGVDLDKPSLESAKHHLESEKYTFIYDDFMGKIYGSFDVVVSLDVVEHIYQEHEDTYFQTVVNNLTPGGFCIIGTPNQTADTYASEPSKLGHVNLYTQDRLMSKLNESFHHVFPFGMNDEVMHTGFAPMSHYLLCLACNKK